MQQTAAVTSAEVPFLMTQHLNSYGNSRVNVRQLLVISNYWILRHWQGYVIMYQFIVDST